MERLKELDILKTLGILLVVLGHVTMVYTSRDIINMGVFLPSMEVITDYIYMFHMPAFVASSGAIYYFGKREKGKYNDYFSFVKNKVARLFIPYFFFLFLMLLPIRVYLGIEENLWSFFMKFFVLLIGPHHLWYIVMIFNVYIIFDFFEDKIYNKKFLVMIVVFLLFNYVGGYIPNVFQLGNTFKYILYFYLGYSFQRYKNRIKHPQRSLLFVFFLFVLTLIFFFFIHSDLSKHNSVFLYLLQIVGAITGVIMLYYLSELFSNLRVSNLSFIRKIGKDSFGIYLFHQGIIYVFVFWLQNFSIAPYLFVGLLFIATLFFSSAFTNLFRRIGWSIFIGENRRK